MMRNRFAVATVLALTGLSACSRSEPDQVVSENLAGEEVDTPAVTAPPVERGPDVPIADDRAPPPASGNAAELSVDEPAAAPDQQMMDDASATGMTSRAPRGDQPAEDAAANGVEAK